MGLGRPSRHYLGSAESTRRAAVRADPADLPDVPGGELGTGDVPEFTPHLRVHAHHGAAWPTGQELAAAVAAADLVITSYGVATRDREALSQIGPAPGICDEAQNIKNSATRQAQAVRGLPAGSRIALTGTPVENRLADLWSIMEFTSPGLLGPAEQFCTRSRCRSNGSGDVAATARLKRITGPFILRR